MNVNGRPLVKNIILLCVLYDYLMMAKLIGRNMVYYDCNEYMIFFYYVLCYSDFILNFYILYSKREVTLFRNRIK
jgi:hypothetical protein